MMARPAYAAADTAALRYADFRDFKAMVRGSARLRDSILVARGLEPVGLPHINDNVKRGNLRPLKAGRCCSTCGHGINKRKNKTGLSMACYQASLAAKGKRCEVCKIALGRSNKAGRCADHRIGPKAAQPNDLVREMVGKVGPLFGVTQTDILSQTRQKAAVEARCVIAVTLKRQGYSLSQIGRRMGRDHSSLSVLVANLPKYAARNPLVGEALEMLA